ncbi:hypothetical protein K6Q96_24235 [Grimontia kaedaensis]|uniref:Uncharacterized protein n=1 Tax=Grimontia kaedaensis TaxID=2872157 RepID=A0ABY4X0P2_9GAMM|nr:hypothetical protein [Grimontia kaedaensis]USH04814.1 hypothetical protein K6Q96_24235 [Grimontia kaedaensis]
MRSIVSSSPNRILKGSIDAAFFVLVIFPFIIQWCKGNNSKARKGPKNQHVKKMNRRDEFSARFTNHFSFLAYGEVIQGRHDECMEAVVDLIISTGIDDFIMRKAGLHG